MIQLLLNKTTPPFQLLPMPKVDLSRIHEVPPLQEAKSQDIPLLLTFTYLTALLSLSGQNDTALFE